MRQKLVIWGASGHALVVSDAVRLQDEYDVAGFIDDLRPERRGEEFGGAGILGGREQLESLIQQGISKLILGFGNCRARLEVAELVTSKGFQFATVIHPRAIVAADASVHEGTVLLAGVVVNSAARLGAHVIVNTSASVDHECVIEDGVHLSPGVHLGGRVFVGRGSWIGIGTTVRDRVSIGAGSVVGAGSVIVDDVPAGVLAYGSPARVIKKIDADA